MESHSAKVRKFLEATLFWRKVCSLRCEPLIFTIMKNSCICLMSALGGAIIGAAVAMLTTPQSGKELRGKIRDSFNEATERVREGLEEMRPCHCNDEHK